MAKTSIFLSAAMALACGAAHAAAQTPTIAKLAVKSTGSNQWAVTITGTNFGAKPSDVPCTACTPIEVGLWTYPGDGQTSMNVTSWTDTKITLSGISASAGASGSFVIHNDSTGLNAIKGEIFPGGSATTPKITSVTISGGGADTHLVIKGKNLGSAITSTITSPSDFTFFQLVDYPVTAPGTAGFTPWGAGNSYAINFVTVSFASWTDNEIVMTGFSGAYGTWTVNSGDALGIAAWAPSSSGNGPYAVGSVIVP